MHYSLQRIYRQFLILNYNQSATNFRSQAEGGNFSTNADEGKQSLIDFYRSYSCTFAIAIAKYQKFLIFSSKIQSSKY